MTESAKCPVCQLRHYSEKLISCIRCGYIFNNNEIHDDEGRIKEWLDSMETVEAEIDGNFDVGGDIKCE